MAVAGESVRGSSSVVCISTHWCRQSYSWLLLIDTDSHAQLESMLPLCPVPHHNNTTEYGAGVPLSVRNGAPFCQSVSLLSPKWLQIRSFF